MNSKEAAWRAVFRIELNLNRIRTYFFLDLYNKCPSKLQEKLPVLGLFRMKVLVGLFSLAAAFGTNFKVPFSAGAEQNVKKSCYPVIGVISF